MLLVNTYHTPDYIKTLLRNLYDSCGHPVYEDGMLYKLFIDKNPFELPCQDVKYVR